MRILRLVIVISHRRLTPSWVEGPNVPGIAIAKLLDKSPIGDHTSSSPQLPLAKSNLLTYQATHLESFTHVSRIHAEREEHDSSENP